MAAALAANPASALMAEPNILHTLRAKQAEIEGYIRDTEKRLNQARADLSHVNATLRLFETKRDETTPFPVYVRMNTLFKRGEVTRLCEEALHAAPEGALDTRQLADHVMTAKGWDASDKALVVSVTRTVVVTLSERKRRNRAITLAGKRDGVNLWRLGN